MSSAGAQAVVVARPLPCCWARPSAWASIGLIWTIWAISSCSCALRRSWNGSHRIMVAIWSPSFVGRAARRLGEDADPGVGDQRSLAEEHCSQYAERYSPVKDVVQESEHEGEERAGASQGTAQPARNGSVRRARDQWGVTLAVVRRAPRPTGPPPPAHPRARGRRGA